MAWKVVRPLIVALTAGVLVLGLGLAALDESGDDDASTSEAIDGFVFSTSRGDPVNVWVSADRRGEDPCMNVGGMGYGTVVSCFARRSALEGGAYSLVVPVSNGLPRLVVGIGPRGAERATVLVTHGRVPADMRGRWFLAEMRDDDLIADNGAAFKVEFDY